MKYIAKTVLILIFFISPLLCFEIGVKVIKSSINEDGDKKGYLGRGIGGGIFGKLVVFYPLYISQGVDFIYSKEFSNKRLIVADFSLDLEAVIELINYYNFYGGWGFVPQISTRRGINSISVSYGANAFMGLSIPLYKKESQIKRYVYIEIRHRASKEFDMPKFCIGYKRELP